MRLLVLMTAFSVTAAVAAYDRFGGQVPPKPEPTRADVTLSTRRGQAASHADLTGEPASHPWSRLAVTDLEATVARPLFEPTRRPPRPPAVRKPVVEIASKPQPVIERRRERPQLRLHVAGIVGDRDELRALLVDAATGKTFRAGPGERVADWTVSHISRTAVALKQDEWTATIELFAKKPRRALRETDDNDQDRDQDREDRETRAELRPRS